VIRFFDASHSALHSGEVYDGRTPNIDRWLGGLTEAQLRLRPNGLNSIIWLLWHMARTEDAAVNPVVAKRSQVLDDDWMRRLAPGRRDIGTGMTDDEVAAFSARVDCDAVIAYRIAVGRRTREVVRTLGPAAWDEMIGVEDMMRANAAGAFRRDLSEVITAGKHPWQGHARGDQISQTAIRHNSMHIGEAVTVRSVAGFPLGV
jgi:hypothetical protein